MIEITKEMVEAAARILAQRDKIPEAADQYEDDALAILTAALALPRKDQSWTSGSNTEAQAGTSAPLAGDGGSSAAPTVGDGLPQSSGRSSNGVCPECREACAKVAESHSAYPWTAEGMRTGIAAAIRSLGVGETPGLCTWPKCDCAEIGRELCSRCGEPAPVDRFHNPQSKDRRCVEVVAPASAAPGGEGGEAKNARNARVQARYDDLMREGKHGHYETMFRVVREEVEAALSRPQPGEGVREALDLTAFVLEDAATVLEHVNSEHKAVAEVWRKQVASARRTLSSPAPQSTGERTGRQLDHSITLAGSLALENETMRAMLSRTLALAASNHWRDKAGLSIKAHPLIDEITLFLAGRNLQSTREQKT